MSDCVGVCMSDCIRVLVTVTTACVVILGNVVTGESFSSYNDIDTKNDDDEDSNQDGSDFQ